MGAKATTVNAYSTNALCFVFHVLGDPNVKCNKATSSLKMSHCAVHRATSEETTTDSGRTFFVSNFPRDTLVSNRKPHWLFSRFIRLHRCTPCSSPLGLPSGMQLIDWEMTKLLKELKGFTSQFNLIYFFIFFFTGRLTVTVPLKFYCHPN
jgi:hypothetical protein